MVGWYHRLDGHEFEQAPGVGDGQGNLSCCSPRGHKESDTTEGLNWPEVCLTRKVMWSDLHLRVTNPLEEGIEAHSNILAWRIPRDRGAWRATVHRVAQSWTRLKWLSMHAHRVMQGYQFRSCYSYFGLGWWYQRTKVRKCEEQLGRSKWKEGEPRGKPEF